MNQATSWDGAVRWLRAQPEHLELIRDCYYDEPALQAAARYASSAEWQAVLPLLPSARGRALDIGAGNGISSYALAAAGWDVTALEPDPSDLVGAAAIGRLAAEASLPISVVQATGENIPRADGTFDVVFARQVLHHARDLRQLCREAARVLRPGGLMIAVREHVLSRESDLPAFLESHPLHRLYGGEHAFTLQQYREALEGAGLRIRRTFGSFDTPINYAPQTRDTLRAEIAARAAVVPGARAAVAGLLGSEATLNVALRLLTRIDSRPGRLFTFVCERPSAS